MLTSSRADYGIYLPLLNELKQDSFFNLHIIAFGTHLSAQYGETVNRITEDGFAVFCKVDTMPDGDSPEAIAHAMGKTMIGFSEIWKSHQFDLIIALGDRFEMFAACAASVPFGIPIAHIHGGETTLGSIDEIFRHCITQMATYHFTAAEKYKERVIALKGSDKNVFNVGALSIDNLKSMKLLTISQIKELLAIDLSVPSILITFHPETIDYYKNEMFMDFKTMQENLKKNKVLEIENSTDLNGLPFKHENTIIFCQTFEKESDNIQIFNLFKQNNFVFATLKSVKGVKISLLRKINTF